MTELSLNRSAGTQNQKVKIISILIEVNNLLNEAAKAQPCPGCKQDIKQLSKFVKAELDFLQTHKKLDKKTVIILKDLDYIDTLTHIGIAVSKIIEPIAKQIGVNAPHIYKKVLNDDMEANQKVVKLLIEASKAVSKIKQEKNHFKIMSKIIDSFIKATEFKLNISPLTFYLFDKTIRFGYKTHMLSITSKVITGLKGIINPLRYK